MKGSDLRKRQVTRIETQKPVLLNDSAN